MTYEEIKSRLVRVENALQSIKTGNSKIKGTKSEATAKFTIIKENLQKLLKEAVEFDNEKDAAEFAEDNPEVPVKITKEASDAPEDIEFDRTKMPIIATAVGKALAKALIKLGDEIARMKAHRLDVNAFDVLVVYKGEGDEDDFSFHIENGNLHIADFSYNEKLVEIGVKPSGDPIINEFNLVEALVNHFRNLEKIRSTNEDIDVGHEDNEPGMIKKQLYRIIKDAKSLYDALGKYEGSAEVDFPSWWQSKITKSQSYLSGAHDYLDSEENVHEALDTSLPDTSKMSLNKLQKVYGMIIDRMSELNNIRKEKGLDSMYMGGSEPGKHSVRDHLVSLTRKKKEVMAAMDSKVAGIGKDQQLTEVTEEEVNDAVMELRNLVDHIEQKADEAREVVRQVFPNELSRLDAYGAFNAMYSANRYDTTLGKFVDRLEEEGFEIEDGEVYTNEEKVDEGDLAYVKDKDYKTIQDLIQFIDDHADNFEKNPQMEPALKFLKRLLRENQINEGTDLYDGDKFSMKRFAGPNGIALQVTARKLKGGGFEYIQIDGDDVKEFARAAVHVAQEFDDIDRQIPVNEEKK